MKKMMLFFLLFAGTGDLLHAQYRLPNEYEVTFNSPEPGKSNATFNFYLAERKKVIMEFNYASQLEYLPDLDSLVRMAIAMLAPLKDSLKADGVVRRTDIILTKVAPRIRIVSHPQYTNTYTIRDKELMQLKINQDTVRIVGFAKSRRMATVNRGGIKTVEQMESPFAIMILVNNTGDIADLPAGTMQQCLALLKPQVQRYFVWDTRDYSPENLFGDFNMVSGKVITRPDPRYYNETGLMPVLGFGLTAVRGSIAPSVQFGFSYTTGNSSFYNKWRLFLEDQTFFSRNAANKLTMDRNQFLTFQLLQNSLRSRNHTLALEGNITLGYLIRRQGEWYERNTFKLGLPVLASRNILIEPQFVFNGFFKNMSPSIKISFNF